MFDFWLEAGTSTSAGEKICLKTWTSCLFTFAFLIAWSDCLLVADPCFEEWLKRLWRVHFVRYDWNFGWKHSFSLVLCFCKNLVHILPKMQLDWRQVCQFRCVTLVAANVALSHYSAAEMKSGLQRTCKLTSFLHSFRLFHFQTCCLQTQPKVTQATSLETIYRASCNSLYCPRPVNAVLL